MVESDFGSELFNRETQTEGEFTVYPYEHLLPTVLQQSIPPPPPAPAENNPYVLLDNYLKSIVANNEEKSGKCSDVKTLKSEISLLHNQLLYERHRREILGLRNRRLLGKTKSSRILEEENTALKDHLLLVKSEIEDLYRQIEEIRREKHLVEEERTTTTKNRDLEIENRQIEIRQLKINLQKMQEIVDSQSREILSQKQDLDGTKAAFFSAQAELDVLKEKESVREASEFELIRLRKELLMMGELQRKYSDELHKSSIATRQEELKIFTNSYESEIKNLRTTLESKNGELESSRAKIMELESLISKKDSVICEKKRLIQRIQDENAEIVQDAKTSYEAMVHLHCQTEGHILELRDQLAQNTRILQNQRKKVTKQRGVSMPSSSGLLNFNATQCVDIEKPEEPSLIFSPDDRSFVVGSPPLSSGGCSLGSDKSEVMKRTLESTQPINLDDEVEIGSAVSAKESYGSINGSGNKH